MSGLTGRRAPNVSQYLANLNTIPSAQELAAQQSNQLEFDQNDLDFLTNTEFFDFDQFNPNNVEPFPAGHPRAPVDAAERRGKAVGLNGVQYPQFGEFQTYPPTVASTPTSLHGAYSHQSPTGINYAGTSPQVGDKRQAGTHASDLEEDSRHAADEDKRRRNTAASARFRVKKKQREQALEKQSKELADKVSLLEGKVQQLEMENKWLKGLITDKNDGKMPDMARAGGETQGKETDERSSDSVKRGIGTEAPQASE